MAKIDCAMTNLAVIYENLYFSHNISDKSP